MNVSEDPEDQAHKFSIKDKARVLAARLTESFARNFIHPHEKPLVEHTLVIVSSVKVEEEQIVVDAIARVRQKAQGRGDSKAAKIFFGALRLLGFGYIEATGEGSVSYVKEEDTDHYVITTTVGVRVESTEALAATVATVGCRLKSLPPGVICALTGIPPTKARLVDVKVDML